MTDYCEPCKEYCVLKTHKNTEKHIFNFLIWEFHHYRKALSKDQQGVFSNVSTKNIVRNEPLNIAQHPTVRRSVVELTLEEMSKQPCGLQFTITIKNQSTDQLFLLECNILLPHPSCTFTEMYPKQEKILEPGGSYNVMVQYQSVHPGKFIIPVMFQFQCNKIRFDLLKEIEVRLASELFSEVPDMENTLTKPWVNVIYVPSKQHLIRKYVIPKDPWVQKAFGCQLRLQDCKEDVVRNKCKTLLGLLESGSSKLTEINFASYFHTLLWLEEKYCETALENYNMDDVELTKTDEDMLSFKVQGLEEKRPSLVMGDIAFIKLTDDNTAYGAEIVKIHNSIVFVDKFNDCLMILIKKNPDAKVQVKFKLSGRLFERLHIAVEKCNTPDYLKRLFPKPQILGLYNTNPTVPLKDDDLINKLLCANPEQKLAVQKILNLSGERGPFIMDGPPGTGKTVTIIEAVYQIVKRLKNQKVLICAPSNSACDMILERLAVLFNPQELVRVISNAAKGQKIRGALEPYYKRDRVHYSDIQKFKIVVTTLMLIGRYTDRIGFTHLFIDEAAQPMEPEALIALGGILDIRGQVILCGDTKQLGPICNSRVAKQMGLGISLMERLLKKRNIYDRNNKDMTIRLINNYRSHPTILMLPNELFYNNELVAISKTSLNDPLNEHILLQKGNGQTIPCAVEFHGVIGEDRRDNKSSSYYNRYEVDVVKKYVENLLTLPIKVTPEEIGIITPYRSQMCYIKRVLSAHTGIEISSVEAFQGREKRVIIISTVRSQPSLLLPDAVYNIGFVSDEKRFNVAITRAMSKVIVIGNPHCLCYDDNWRAYIKLCQSMRSYKGCPFLERNVQLRRDITNRLRRIKTGDEAQK